MARKKGSLIFSLLCVVTIMVIIFMFSSQTGNGSSELSIKISRLICRIVFFNFENMSSGEQAFIVNELHYFVRKLAHFSVYMLLGFFSYAGLVSFKDVLKKPAVIALTVCAVYAISDEIHQHFIPGRSMRVTDMLLDTFGSFIGIIVAVVLLILLDHIKNNFFNKIS